MGKGNSSSGYLSFMLTTFVCGSLLFLVGFFPASQNLIDYQYKGNFSTNKPTVLDGIDLKIPKERHQQIILMIIDAFRSDFSNNVFMPIVTASACHVMDMKVDIPTVTMPRLKSLMSGIVSNFIDIVLNLGYGHRLSDSVLHRLKANNKSIVFAGDSVWEDLFPNTFLRKQLNTESFFVSDFYKGDINITNTLKKELLLRDWDLLILHYLGLDHIGHIEGTDNSKVADKLMEMDAVATYIVQSQKHFENRSLIITADHGMRDGGGHGGSSKEELYVPLILLQKNCGRNIAGEKIYPTVYRQIDLAATLAILLDVEIPMTSIGGIIPELMENYSMDEQLYYYLYNTQHLLGKMFAKFSEEVVIQEDYYKWYLEAQNAHKEFLLGDTSSMVMFERAKQNYIRLCKQFTRILSSSLVKFEYDVIIVAIILTTLCAIAILINTLFEYPYMYNTTNDTRQILGTLIKCYVPGAIINYVAHYMHWIQYRGFMCAFLFTIPITFSIFLYMDILKLLIQILLPLNVTFRAHFKLTIPPLLLMLFLFHAISLTSTSFIEEEHQTWYYLTPTILIYLTIQNFYNNMKQSWREKQRNYIIFDNSVSNKTMTILYEQLRKMGPCLAVMLTLIFCRRLNQSGNKWYHLVDLGDQLNQTKNVQYLHFLLLISLALLWHVLKRYSTAEQMFTHTGALVSVFCYRQSTDKPIITVIVFWICVLLTFCIQYCQLVYHRLCSGHFRPSHLNLLQILKTNLSCCLLIGALLHNPHNVILLPAMMFTLETIYRLCDNLYIKNQRSYNRCYVLITKTVLTIFVSNMFYFFQGNTNSLSSINLSPGYIGITSYNPIIVASLITFNMYCAQINAFLCLMCHMFATQMEMLPLRQEKEQITNSLLMKSTEDDLQLVLNVFTTSVIMPIAFYWCILLNFRYHLFLYSVFAPKAIYECFRMLVFYFNFNLITLYFKIFK